MILLWFLSAKQTYYDLHKKVIKKLKQKILVKLYFSQNSEKIDYFNWVTDDFKMIFKYKIYLNFD